MHNDHLGQIVSGKNQIIKNIDQSLKNERKAFYSLLGPSFTYLSKFISSEHPLTSLNKDPPSKSIYKETIATRMSVFHENELKLEAKNNSKMKFFNVSLV